MRSAIIAATVANRWRGKDEEAYEPRDFMPEFEPAQEQEPQTWQEQLRIVEMLNAALGGVDKRKR